MLLHRQLLTYFAVLSHETGDTVTRVRDASVSARRSVSTRAPGAFVDL